MMPSTSTFSANALSKAVLATFVTHIIKTTAHKKRNNLSVSRRYFYTWDASTPCYLGNTEFFLDLRVFRNHLLKNLPKLGLASHFLHFRQGKELNKNQHLQKCRIFFIFTSFMNGDILKVQAIFKSYICKCFCLQQW